MKSALSLTSATAMLLIAGHAVAADAVVYEPIPEAPPMVQAYDWSGPYIGVFGGLAAGHTQYTVGSAFIPDTFATVDVSSSGFLGGVQAGYDWQFNNNWVLGAVADIAYTSYGPSIEISSGGAEAEIESQLNYLGTVRARLGHAWDRSLFYIHGGFAYGQTEQTVEIVGIELFNEEQTRTGWTAGAGAEFLVTQRLSFGVEYAYVDLGEEEIFRGDVAIDGLTIEEEFKFHTLKAMLNFRF